MVYCQDMFGNISGVGRESLSFFYASAARACIHFGLSLLAATSKARLPKYVFTRATWVEMPIQQCFANLASTDSAPFQLSLGLRKVGFKMAKACQPHPHSRRQGPPPKSPPQQNEVNEPGTSSPAAFHSLVLSREEPACPAADTSRSIFCLQS